MSGDAPLPGRVSPWIVAALAPRDIDCFAWQDDGATLTTTTGATVAFRGEVRAVLRALAPGGLPPFAALFALLAATSSWWSEARAMMLARTSPAIAIDDDLRRRLDTTIGMLDRVHDYPAELRTPLGARVHLALAACEPMIGRSTPARARELVLAFERGLTAHCSPRQPTDAASALAREIVCLRPGLERLDAASLRRRIATGLDDELQAAHGVDWMPPALAARRLIAELLADPEHGALARLAQRVEAALPPPAAELASTRMATAGVAGLTNRGPLERLVTTELAWDDETLAARIALGEALYTSREPERARTPGARVILLDAGMRMWGVRRVLATAVAMALVSRAPSGRNDTVLAWRAEGDRIVPIDLGSRAGVEAHLGGLSTASHPGAALDRLSGLLDELALQGARVEPVLVTCQEALDDPELREALAARDSDGWLVVTAGNGGRVRLAPVSRGRAGMPLVDATLALDDILARSARPTPAPPPVIVPGADGLPTVLYRRDFPFRLPYLARLGAVMLPTAAGAIGTTRDHRILLSDDPRRCAIQLLDSVPADESWVLRAPGDELIIVQRMARAARVVRLDPLSRSARFTNLEDPRAEHMQSAVLMGETLTVLCGRHLLAFDADSGELLHERELPHGSRHLGAGVFWIERSCRRLSCARGRFEEEVLPARGEELRTAPLAAFQRSHGRGLWGVSRESPAILSLSDDEPALRYRGACTGHTLRGVSHDGNRVVLSVRSSKPDRRREILLDLESGTVRSCEAMRRGARPDEPVVRSSKRIAPADLMRYFEPRVMSQVDVAHGVRTRFSGVFIDEVGALGLLSHRRVPLLIRIVQAGESSQLALVRRDVDLRRARALAHFDLELRPPAGAGYRLRAGTFRCGSRAILDSRGLLHLRSAVQGIPEISLVLGDRWLAGWSSEGRVTGPRHFLATDEQHVEPALFDVGLRHFAAAVE